MPLPLLGLIAFLEGFASLGIEVIALRRLVPHLGSSIAVTAPTIGLFLLALSLGYWQGGRTRGDGLARIARNFTVAALLAGVGLSRAAVDALFAASTDPWLAYLIFMGAIVGPSAWCLAQTVPLLAERMAEAGAGRASGLALTASTAGSVLGAVSLSWGVMQWAGVGAAVMVCAGSLGLGLAAAALTQRRWARAVAWALGLAGLAVLNLGHRGDATADTAYADYRVRRTAPGAPVPAGREAPVQVFEVNGQRASELDAGTPPRRAAYIERLHTLIVDTWRWREASILVLGAGGFTLSLQDRANTYTYVDIDPRIREIAEAAFLKAPVQGRFLADDARRHVLQTKARHRAVVVDVFSAHASVPAHLVTLEFWRALPRVLEPGGVVFINLILDARLQSRYARSLRATVEAGLGPCATEVLAPAAALSNVLMICQPGPTSPEAPPGIYTDEHNRVDLDRGRLGF